MKKIEALKPRCVLVVKVNGTTVYAHLEKNEAAEAFIGKLESQGLPIVFRAGEEGGMAHLPWALPKNDTRITARPGDFLLTKDDQLFLSFDEKTGAFTRIGGIGNMTADKRGTLFGNGDFTAHFSLEWDE